MNSPVVSKVRNNPNQNTKLRQFHFEIIGILFLCAKCVPSLPNLAKLNETIINLIVKNAE
jgi:hypothetical protein